MSLRESSKVSSGLDQSVVKVGDIILKTNKLARSFWKLAKVEELIPSRDNVFRAARIRVINSEKAKATYLRQPIQHLIPLELSSMPDEPEAMEKPMGQTANNDARSRRTAAVIGELLRKNQL